MTGRLEGKVCVVVGAGQTPGETVGNGRAASLAYAREGGRLVLVDKSSEQIEGTAQMLRDEGGGDAQIILADVTIEADCAAIVERTIDACSRIDVLHYNVGKSAGDTEVSRLPADNWHDIMAMNLTGFYLCCKYALPPMREQRGGVITAISSVAAVAAMRNMTYKTSKAGMNALVQAMAIDNGRYGVRVNAIMPGLMDTPMAIERRAAEQNKSRDEIRSERDRQVPLLGKMGTGWDVANAAVFLASDEARYITGVALAVDGGLSARVG